MVSDTAVVRRRAAPVVRPAAIADARRMATINVRSWRSAYRGMLPDALLDSLDAKAITEDFVHTLANRRPRRAILVAEGGRGPIHRVVAYAALGPANEESSAGIKGPANEVAQLQMIDVDPRWMGRGFGHALHEAILEVAQTLNFRKAVLWVLPENAGARAFYESHGWTCEATERTEQMDGHPVPQIRYVRDV
jgi:GNAT superfamily N-acetyltransferase